MRRFRQAMFALLVLSLAFAPGVVRAQPSGAFTTREAFGLSKITDVALSPDGTRIAWVVERKDLAANIRYTNVWVAGTDGSAARALTDATVTNNDVTWSPDGRSIAFISSRDSTRAVWVIGADGGSPRKLPTGTQPASRPRWSPDGSRIAFLAAEPLTAEEEAQRERKQNDARVIDEVRHPVRLWTIAADGSGSPVRLTSGDRQVNEAEWSPDGRSLALMTTPATGEYERMVETRVTIVSADGTGARDLIIDKAWTFGSVHWSPDGKSVAFMATYPALKLAERRIKVVDVATGKTRTLPPDFDGGVTDYVWTAAGSLIYSAVTGVTGRLFRHDIASDRSTPLGDASAEQVFQRLSIDRTGTRMAYVASHATDPGNIWVSPVASYTPKRVTDINPQFAGLRLGAYETVTWKGADAWPMDGVLVKPPGYTAGRRYPTIVFIHGGPSGVNSKVFDPFWELLAASGYVVFAPNPRAGTGHGDKFYAANYRDFGGKDFQDIMRGVDHVIASGVSDAERLGVWGWSYGGYMTYWAITQTDRFKAAMSGAGMSNLTSFYGQSDIQSVWGVSYMGKSPFDDPAIYRERSAITHVNKVKTPTLILYGEAEIRIPFAQGREFYVALRERGVPTQLVLYPREFHTIVEPDHERDTWERSIAWFDKYIPRATVP